VDTSPSAAAAQNRILRELPPARRFLLALDMSLAARALLEARLHAEHPGWSAAQIRREVLQLNFPGVALPPSLE
jgi:hypothetical protein